MERVDVVVIGAGTAGAAAAGFCAAGGLRVLCLERGPLDLAGARWVNAVPHACFEAAGLERSSAETVGGGEGFHLVAGWGPERLHVPRMDVREIDMRRLVRRLQTLAWSAGARLVGHVRVFGLEGDRLVTDAGPVRADVVVDASGLGGVGLLDVPRPGPTELCAAAQEVRLVRDPDGARRFLDQHGARPGEAVCFTGVAGGYSIVNVKVQGDHVGLLAGAVPALGQASGLALLRRFVLEQAWIGERVFGGARAIPLVPPPAPLASDRVALVGDAAGQVFASHGSGIGAGLVAARVLADALIAGQGTRGYDRAWQRRFGGLFAGTALFAALSRTFDAEDVRTLLLSGVLTPSMVRANLEQQDAFPAVTELPGQIAGAVRSRRLLRRIAPVVARMALVRAHYARYPGDPAALPAWREKLARISGAAGAAPAAGRAARAL